MKKMSLAMVGVLLLAVVAHAAWNDPHFRRNPKSGNIIAAGDNGALEDTGVSATQVTNFVGMLRQGGFVKATNDASVVVSRGGSAVQSWASLTNAYRAAKQLTPNGLALSETNRALVIIPPGKYDAGNHTLVLDTDYVDISAMSPEVVFSAHRDYTLTHEIVGIPGWTNTVKFAFPKTRIVGAQSDTNSHYAVFKQTVEDVRLTGFSLEAGCPDDYQDIADEDRTFHMGLWVTAPEGGNKSRYEKMTFWSEFYNPAGELVDWGFPTMHQFHFDGEWRDCVANDFAFRLFRDAGYAHTGTNQYFRASMYNCHGGTHSFAGDSESGQMVGAYFEGCTAMGAAFSGCTSYSMPIDSTTKFVDCHAPFGSSFGIMTSSAATMIRCSGGPTCAGGSHLFHGPKAGQFTGYAEDCDFGQGSFGGRSATSTGIPDLNTNQYLSGELVRCTIRDTVAPIQLKGATIRDSYFVQSSLIYTNWVYAEIVDGVTNQLILADDDYTVSPPWYNLGSVTNEAASDMFMISDSDSLIMDSIFEINTSGTGTVVTAESPNSVVFLNNSFNNADVDDDGLAANVTLTSGPGGWSYRGLPSSVFLHDGSQPMTGSIDMDGFNILDVGTIRPIGAYLLFQDPVWFGNGMKLNSGNFTLGSGLYVLDSTSSSAFYMDATGLHMSAGGIEIAASTLDMNGNNVIDIGTFRTLGGATLSILDPLSINDGVELTSGNFILGSGQYILNSTSATAFTMDATGLNVSAGDISLTSGEINFADGTTMAGRGLVTKVATADYTIGTTDPMELYGGLIYVNSASAVTLTIPSVADGMHFTVISANTGAVYIDPNGSDLIRLDGVAMSDGDRLLNSSSVNDAVTITYFDSTGFYAMTDGNWTDAN